LTVHVNSYLPFEMSALGKFRSSDALLAWFSGYLFQLVAA